MSCDERAELRAKFMADVSHDLKTPLNAIIGFTSVLLQDKEQLGAEKARQLGLVYKSAHRLLGRVDALAEFFRLKAGVAGPQTDWFSPRRLIGETFEQFRDDAREKGVELRLGQGPVPSRLRSVPELVSRILRELVANAVRFTASGAVTVDVQRQDDRVAFRVSDTGSGLSVESQQCLSQSLGPAGAYAGLGLGLALSREAALRLGGHIEVVSRPGAGSTFTLVVELPDGDVEM
jgi:signal transduction histidine kinase